MKKFKNLFLLLLAVGSLTFTSCLHIVEELTTRNNGSGTYKLTFDMHEMKDMVDMVQSMAGDSMGSDAAGAPAMGNPMAMMGMASESMQLVNALKAVPGVTNVSEVSDTTNFISSFTFDFANPEALNRGLAVIFKDRFDKKIQEPYKNGKKKFERLATADFGQLFRSLLDEASEAASAEESGAAGMGDMASMFFSSMTYKQVYHFPDRTVKKSSNPLSEISADKRTVTIELKPFDKEQQDKNPTVATEISLKK